MVSFRRIIIVASFLVVSNTLLRAAEIQPSSFLTLPKEIQYKIFNKLSPLELLDSCDVCHSWMQDFCEIMESRLKTDVPEDYRAMYDAFLLEHLKTVLGQRGNLMSLKEIFLPESKIVINCFAKNRAIIDLFKRSHFEFKHAAKIMNKDTYSFPDCREWFINPKYDRGTIDWNEFINVFKMIEGIFVTRSSVTSMVGRFVLIEGSWERVFGANHYLMSSKSHYPDGTVVDRDNRKYCSRSSVVLKNEKQSFLKINDMIYFNNDAIVELLDPISSSDSQTDTSSSDSESNE